MAAVILLLLIPPILASVHSRGQVFPPPRSRVLFRGPLRIGGDLLAHTSIYPYSPVGRELSVINRIDSDGDGIEDYLEELIESGNVTGNVSVIVFFAAKPGAFGGNAALLVRGLREIMDMFSNNGGYGFRGLWVNVIVGFSARVPAKAIKILGSIVKSFDVNGDGIPERGVIALDRVYHALNYWSARQLGVRPWVWGDLGVNGSGVTVAVIDTGIDGANTAFPQGKIVWWKDYVGDANGNIHSTPYDDNMHGTHVAGTVAGVLNGRDPQGRLVLNFGISDLDLTNYAGEWITFRAPYMAYYVNTTGTIEIDFKWKPDTTAVSTQGSIDEIGLAYCGWIPLPDCNRTLVATLQTPEQDTWYNLTYNVDDPSKFGFYVLYIHVGTGGGVAILPIMHFPVDPGDNWGYLYGMAPGAKLAGAKVLSYAGSGSTSDIVSAIDDVVGNRTSTQPPIFIISMSLGGGYDSTLDTAVSNAVQAGVVVVVAAGNDGPGSGTAATGSPANNPYAITVAAIDATGNITSYSSDGGQSSSDSVESGDVYIKPDIAAPGGGDVLVIYSADTTWHDDLSNAVTWLFFSSEDIDWPDAVNINTTGYDDGLGISGTSMATPHVSGVAALVISALLENPEFTWDWSSSSTALLVKNILLISTYETYPLEREENASYSPTLDKGGQDIHEGYGALDAQAAVKLALALARGEALVTGSIANFTLRPGELYGNVNYTAGEWSPSFGLSVYAVPLYVNMTSFTLSNGSTYVINYTIRLHADTEDPTHTDYDLYVYNLTPDKYGRPQILASSTQGMGVTDEVVYYTPSSKGTFILVAKRAREDSAGGSGTIIIGPYARVEGYNGSSWTPGIAYLGLPVRIQAVLASGASQAWVTVFDNTTGAVVDKFVLNATVEPEGYSLIDSTWTMPDDPSLDGHSIVFILTTPTGEGPITGTATAEEAPAPIPEPSYLALAASVAVVVILLLGRRQ